MRDRKKIKSTINIKIKSHYFHSSVAANGCRRK